MAKTFKDVQDQASRIIRLRYSKAYKKMSPQKQASIAKAAERAALISQRYAENMAGALGRSGSMYTANRDTQENVAFAREQYTDMNNGDLYRMRQGKKGTIADRYNKDSNFAQKQLEADAFMARLGNKSALQSFNEEGKRKYGLSDDTVRSNVRKLGRQLSMTTHAVYARKQRAMGKVGG